MLNREGFYEYIKDNVLGYLPPSFEGGKIELTEVIKNNDEKLTSINIVKRGESVCPAIYLNKLYEQYTDGKELDSCVANVADYRIEYDVPDLISAVMDLTNYSVIKDNLQVRICDPEWNTEKLSQMPHTIIGDFAAIYYINQIEEKVGTTSVPVKNEMLNVWGVSKEQVHADAMAADKERMPMFCNMSDIMDELIFGKEPHNMLTEEGSIVHGVLEAPMYILTNEERAYGASLIFHDEILEKIGEIMKSDYYVLPSSCHEVLILPDFTEMPLAEMTDMVRDINSTQVELRDRLSDKIQYYSRDEKVLENAQHRENRLSAEMEIHSGKSIKDRITEAKKEVSAFPRTASEYRSKSMDAVI